MLPACRSPARVTNRRVTQPRQRVVERSYGGCKPLLKIVDWRVGGQRNRAVEEGEVANGVEGLKGNRRRFDAVEGEEGSFNTMDDGADSRVDVRVLLQAQNLENAVQGEKTQRGRRYDGEADSRLERCCILSGQRGTRLRTGEEDRGPQVDSEASKVSRMRQGGNSLHALADLSPSVLHHLPRLPSQMVEPLPLTTRKRVTPHRRFRASAFQVSVESEGEGGESGAYEVRD